MNNKKLVIERLDQIKVESGHSDKTFKSTLVSITGKTPRTIRRWYSLESNIHESDIERIAKYFGKHVHWLRYGDRRKNPTTTVDQIMTSSHFGAVILKDERVEEMNFKFIEMMDLANKELQREEICTHILQSQSDVTSHQYKLNNDLAVANGVHTSKLTMILGDNKEHLIESTSLHLNNGRILKILADKGVINADDYSSSDNNYSANSDRQTTPEKRDILFIEDDTPDL